MTDLEKKMFKDKVKVNIKEMSKEEKDNYVLEQISLFQKKLDESQKKINASYSILLFFLIAWILGFCYYIYLFW
jgi:agmatine/peptidylarginine deiminase